MGVWLLLARSLPALGFRLESREAIHDRFEGVLKFPNAVPMSVRLFEQSGNFRSRQLRHRGER